MTGNPVRLFFTGDFCPINRIEDMAITKKYDAIFNDFIDEFRKDDLNIIDLECPLTLSDDTRPKIGPHQKAHPDCIGALKYAGIHVAAIANNHFMDYDLEGAMETLEVCRRNDIITIGVANNEEEAAKPFTTTIRGRRLALLNFADNEFLSSTDNSLTCSAINPLQLFYSIKEVRSNHDYVVIIIHAGNEFYELPSPRTKKLYRFIIDAGADAVVSHHTHAFSGYEVYRSKPIFYGLGNFIYDFPGKRNEAWNYGYAVRLFLDDTVDFQLVPLKQGNEKPGVFHLEDEETDTFLDKINRLNQIIANDRQLEDEFGKYCNIVNPMYEAYIEPNFGKYISFLRRRGFFPRFMTRRKRMLLLNIIRCDSHRDVLIRMLEKGS
jgi:poly-gamma-glutamate synthesis protein (capsule biosynthesis protein)